MKIHGKYKIADCEHYGDIESISRNLLKRTDNAITITDSYWDGSDCGEAYITFEFNYEDYDKVNKAIGGSIACSFVEDINNIDIYKLYAYSKIRGFCKKELENEWDDPRCVLEDSYMEKLNGNNIIVRIDIQFSNYEDINNIINIIEDGIQTTGGFIQRIYFAKKIHTCCNKNYRAFFSFFYYADVNSLDEKAIANFREQYQNCSISFGAHKNKHFFDDVADARRWVNIREHQYIENEIYTIVCDKSGKRKYTYVKDGNSKDKFSWKMYSDGSMLHFAQYWDLNISDEIRSPYDIRKANAEEKENFAKVLQKHKDMLNKIKI